MAGEGRYSSDRGSNKRKHEEEFPPLPRRPTASTSGPIPSASPPGSGSFPPLCKSFPPLPAADDVQAQVKSAKQRVEEIASPQLWNPGAGGSADGKHMMSTPSAIPVSYNYGQGTSKKIDIPNGRVGVIIGKAGETIKYLEVQSGAKIQVAHGMDAASNSLTRPVDLMGTPEQIAKAEQLINDVLTGVEAGGPGVISKTVTGQTGSDQFVMKIPNNKVGLVIGKRGETIKNMQARTGARIQVIPLHLPPGVRATDSNLYIDGTSEQIGAAKLLVNEVISKISFLHNIGGSSLAPIYSGICLLSIKTMALRIEKLQENAQKIAEFLSSHPRVKKVYYAGLPDHPGHVLRYKQAKGAGSLLSFVTGSVALSRHIVDTTKYFRTIVGFGSTNSLISMPCFLSHKSILASVREARGLTEDLIRISVGIEDVTDLICDLDTALRAGPS